MFWFVQNCTEIFIMRSSNFLDTAPTWTVPRVFEAALHRESKLEESSTMIEQPKARLRGS